MSVCIYAYRAGAGASDPLAAVLLLTRPRLGVMLAVAIITAGVALNAWVGATRVFQLEAFAARGLLPKFRAATARLVWLRRRSPWLRERLLR